MWKRQRVPLPGVESHPKTSISLHVKQGSAKDGVAARSSSVQTAEIRSSFMVFSFMPERSLGRRLFMAGGRGIGTFSDRVLRQPRRALQQQLTLPDVARQRRGALQL